MATYSWPGIKITAVALPLKQCTHTDRTILYTRTAEVIIEPFS